MLLLRQEVVLYLLTIHVLRGICASVEWQHICLLHVMQ